MHAFEIWAQLTEIKVKNTYMIGLKTQSFTPFSKHGDSNEVLILHVDET